MKKPTVLMILDGYAVFYGSNDFLWADRDLCDRPVGIYEPSRVSGGGDHAVGRDLGVPGWVKLLFDHGDHGGGRTFGKRPSVWIGTDRRGAFPEKMVSKVSQAAGND